jgi:hypothetical protein
MTASNKNPNGIRLSTRDIRNRDKKKKRTYHPRKNEEQPS